MKKIKKIVNLKSILLFTFFISLSIIGLIYMTYNNNISDLGKKEIYVNKVYADNNWIYWDYIYIPAVLSTNNKEKNNTEGKVYIFQLFYKRGDGYFMFKVPPIYSEDTQYSFLFSLFSVYKILSSKTLDYDYKIDINSLSKAEGPSASAGVALLLYSLIKDQHIKNRYAITGFMLPNGIIAPIGGLNVKLKAVLNSEIPYLVAPGIEIKNKTKNLIPIYTILQFDPIFYNISEKIYLPPKDALLIYKKYMKRLTKEICFGVKNKTIENLINLGEYYPAASLCYIWKLNNTRYINLRDLESLNKSVYTIINNISCASYSCKEILYQVKSRYIEAQKMNNSIKKYWRLYTAKQWASFLNISYNIHREDTCEDIDTEFYLVISYLNLNIPENISCFKKREILANIYTSLLSHNLSYEGFKEIKNLLFYYMNKHGFSIPAYAYYSYAKYWISKNPELAKYYLILALEYAE